MDDDLAVLARFYDEETLAQVGKDCVRRALNEATQESEREAIMAAVRSTLRYLDTVRRAA